MNPSDPGGGDGGPAFGGGIGYSFSNWPIPPLDQIELSSDNTFPIVGPQGQEVRAAEDWIIRDPYPVTDLDGNLARIDGWYMVAGLATPRNDPPSTLNEVSFLLSRDGVHWMEGGTLYSVRDDGIPGDQLFSGDLRYDVANDRLLIYYTAVDGTEASEFVQGPSGAHMRQLIGVSEARPTSTPEGLRFTEFVHHGIQLEPDGRWYARPEEANTETEVYGFRDPWIFRDPESSETFMLFTANWGSDQTVGFGSFGDEQFPDAGPHNADPNLPRNDGVVGIARATDDSLIDWELLPPLFGAIGVNTQLELPHFVYEDGRYYLLTTTHNRTFIGDQKYENPEGFYGFVSEEIEGPYLPINGSSLVFSNPPQDMLQTYAWKAFPTGDGRATVISFINKGNSGTIAPVVELAFAGNTAEISRLQPLASDEAPVPTTLSFGTSPTVPPGAWPFELPREVADEIFVTELYQELLGRSPEPGALDAWAAFIDDGGTREEVVSRFLGSEEYLGRIVEEAYGNYLGRAPDPMGLAGWTEFLADGNSAEDLAARLIASDEYARLRGDGIDAFLSGVYDDVLGRSPDAGGLAAWAQGLEHGEDRLLVARQFLRSEEARRGQIDGLYRRFLGRSAEESGVQAWLAILADGTSRERAVATILASPEYGGRLGL
jgi:levansucrase